MAANEQGLLLCWHLCSSSPEPKPNRITKVEVNSKKLNRYSSAGTKADSEQKEEDLFVSQHSSKPNVACCPFVKLVLIRFVVKLSN